MSLKDELVKAGLVSAKQARQVAHKERVERKQSGGEHAQQEAEARAEEARREREAQRARDQLLAREQQAEKSERERRQAQLDAALRDGRIEHWQGGRTYYFTDGIRIESLSVSDEATRRLQEGTAAIVRSDDPGAPFMLLNAAQASRLRELAPERVVTLHPRQA